MRLTGQYPADMPSPSTLRDRFLLHFLECENALRGFITTVMACPADRDDVLQEVALRLWQLYPRYDAARPFTPWALGVAARRMKEEARRAARRPVLPGAEVIERMAGAFTELICDEQGEDQAALAECLAALPEDAASLVRSRYFARQSIADLAAATGQSSPAIYQSLHRLRRRLAGCIRARLQSPPTLRHAERP